MSKLEDQLTLKVEGQRIGPLSERDYLSLLLEQGDEFCRRLGVGKYVILETYLETSDWTFIIKVDALHETACRDFISRLRTTGESGKAAGKEIHAFIEEIGLQARDSALRLIELMEGPKEYVRFLKCLKRVRDAFAHDIRSVNKSLVEMIEALGDRVQLSSAFSAIGEEGYDAAKRAGIIRDDPGFLRFGILHQSMALLCLMHANLFEGAVDGIDKIREVDPCISSSRSLRLIGETGDDQADRLSTPCHATGSQATLNPDSRTTPATFFRHSFTNPKRPNQIRSLWIYMLAFSAKSLVTISGLVAAIAMFSFFGMWPAIVVGVIALLPVALDKWTPGAWKGRCPHCDSQIAVSSRNKANPDFGCPACAERIVLRGNSFLTL